MSFLVSLFIIVILAGNLEAQSPAADDPRIPPEVLVQAGDYRAAREAFTTHLVKHGGFAFGPEDWEMTWPYRAAGFVVMVPMLRGENGNPGEFTMFYDEVNDVLAAAAFLASRPDVDADRIFLAGHSVGGTMALLAAMTSNRFRAVASFSGSPDQVIYCRLGVPQKIIPFDTTDAREFEMRSPLAYATSLRSPTRLYYGTRELHWDLSTRALVELARAKGLDVNAEQVEGGHESAVPEAMSRSIQFFQQAGGPLILDP